MRNFIKTFIKATNAYRNYRRTFNELGRLSDKELRDIGITRGDIYKVAANANAE